MSNIRFYEYNILSSTNITASSAQSALPVTNAVNAARTKVWSPSGRFTIDSTNNKVYINDGADKTVTLTSADYTTPALMATHVQTQLNASSSNWTVSYSTSTHKFTISNTGSVTLKLTSTTNAAWDTLGYTGVADDTGTSFVADEERIHTSETLIIDGSAAQEATLAAIIADRDEVFTLSSTATCTIEANNADSWASPAYSKAMTISDRGAFATIPASTSYRYWRIKIVDRRNTLGATGLKFGYIYVGTHSTTINTNIKQGFSKSIKDQSIIMESENGQKYADIRPQYEVFSSLGMDVADITDRQTVEALFSSYGTHTPFFVSLDPSLAISNDLDDLTRYVRFSGDLGAGHQVFQYNQMSFTLEEAL